MMMRTTIGRPGATQSAGRTRVISSPLMVIVTRLGRRVGAGPLPPPGGGEVPGDIGVVPLPPPPDAPLVGSGTADSSAAARMPRPSQTAKPRPSAAAAIWV